MNDMKTQFKQQRYYPPKNMTNMYKKLYPENFMNMLLRRNMNDKKEKVVVNSTTNSVLPLIVEDCHEEFQISNIFNQIQSKDGSTKKPKCILVDGATGMGKTTLCKEIAYQWANGNVLIGTKIVFLLFLTNPAVQKIHDLKDFIHYFYNFDQSCLDLSKKCAQMFEKRDNSDITILMDGYDEFHDKSEFLMIQKIRTHKVLSQCQIMITCRPIASKKLQNLVNVTFEVMDFTKQSKSEYIKKELKGDFTKINSLHSYLDSHSDIDNMCCTPIMMTILVCTYKICEELPTNQSELYERCITLAIIRFLQKFDDTLPIILSLNKLPEKFNTNLQELTKFAFEAIGSKNMVFSDADIKKLSPNLALFSKDLQGLGLLKPTEHSDMMEMDEDCAGIVYGFLHSSIPKFLAAYYLKSLEASKQFEIVRKHIFIDSYIDVWVMFFGLQQSASYDFHNFLTYTYIRGATDRDQDTMKLILRRLHLLNFSEVKNIDIKNVKGTFKLFCCKNNENDLQTHVIHETFKFDSQCLLQKRLCWTKLFISLCSVNSSDQLIEIYLFDKSTYDHSYHQIVGKLEQNQNLSVILLSSNTLVGYRCNYDQLLSGLEMNYTSLESLILRHCQIIDNTANTLSTYFVSSHCLKHLCITNCNISNHSVLQKILQPLKKYSNLKILNLNNNHITGQVAVDLADVIKNNKELEKLYLSGNDLKLDATVILQALKEKFNLKVLQLNDNGMTEKVAEDLANVIKNNKGLEELYLSNNSLKSAAAVILKALKENSVLRKLSFSGNLMTQEVAEDLVDVINNNRNIEHLFIRNNKLGPSVVAILQALKVNCNIKFLNLSGNNMTKQVVVELAQVIKNYSNLEDLYLSDNNLQSAASVVLQALKEISSLRLLHLNNNSMTQDIVEDLADVIRNNSNLMYLSLRNNKLGAADDILQALKEKSNLRVLNLNNNNMTEKVAESLADVVKNNSQLEELYLSDNDLKLSATKILNALKQNSSLRLLHLNDNLMTQDVAKDLADVIKNNPNLEHLSIRNNKLGLEAVAILQALKEKSNLKFLNLISNYMSGEVSEDLAEVIKSNSSLEELYLSYNNLGSSVVFLQALKGASKLKVLSLSNNQLSSNFPTHLAAAELTAVIKNNPLITRIWLGGNMLQSGLINITSSCRSLRNLQALQLSHNNINPQEITHLSSLVANISSLKALTCSGLVLNVKERYYRGIFQCSDMINSKSSCNIEIVCLEMWRSQFAGRMKLNYHYSNYFPTVIADVQVTLFLTEEELRTASSIAKDAKQKLSQLDATSMINCLSNIIKTLEMLDLRYSNINQVAAVQLAKALNYNNVLEQLWLRGNALGTDGANVILTSLQNITTLRVLDLSYNNISSGSADDIATVIKRNLFLEQLWLEGNELTTGVVTIASALKRHSNLTLLCLSNSGITDDAAEEICAIINSNTSLRGLLLSNNKLQSIGTSKIARSLYGMKFLHILELTNNCIDATAVDKLAVTIPHCSALKELYLGNNNFRTTGAITICQVLKTIPLLQVLSLNSNNISKEATSEICDVIKTNTNLAILLLGHNDLQTIGVQQIVNAVKDNNQTMQLLSLSDNNVDEQTKKCIEDILCDHSDLELFI